MIRLSKTVKNWLAFASDWHRQCLLLLSCFLLTTPVTTLTADNVLFAHVHKCNKELNRQRSLTIMLLRCYSSQIDAITCSTCGTIKAGNFHCKDIYVADGSYENWNAWAARRGEGGGKKHPSMYLMFWAELISYAWPYMEWPAARYFHWLSSDHTQ